MNIGILSRGPQLYSTQSLYRAGRMRGHEMYLLDHTQCSLLLEDGRPQVFCGNRPVPPLDAVIPRIGASVTSQGASVIAHFEMMNVFTAAGSLALLNARDKLRCLQQLTTHGIPAPHTVFLGNNQDLEFLVRKVGGLPVVVKMLESTHGVGVVLCETLFSLKATVEAFQQLRERIILQEFIAESNGADVRAFVVDGEIVAAMKRQAQDGEFRSNLHRGATATPLELSAREKELVQDAVRIMNLPIAGVDLLQSDRGPLIMEVNASPGLEGIETATGVNIAGKIITFVERSVKARRSTSNR